MLFVQNKSPICLLTFKNSVGQYQLRCSKKIAINFIGSLDVNIFEYQQGKSDSSRRLRDDFGFLYHHSYSRSDSGESYWRCQFARSKNVKCKATRVTSLDNFIIRKYNDHNHSPGKRPQREKNKISKVSCCAHPFVYNWACALLNLV